MRRTAGYLTRKTDGYNRKIAQDMAPGVRIQAIKELFPRNSKQLLILKERSG